MTTTEFTLPVEAMRAAPAPDRVGQATAVEQSRAVAEVQAAVVLAHQSPRDEDEALAKLAKVCQRPAVADRAFYAFPRGKETVTDITIHLAREMARCWGNITYGVVELRREADQSEMLAYAWDMESNVRPEVKFIVHHSLDVKNGRKRLSAQRDIYEKLANDGARRLREQIKAVIPQWFIDEAERMCRETIDAADSGVPLGDRIAKALAAFEEIGITRDTLEAKRGRPVESWSTFDLSQLRTLIKSIKRGEITMDEAFPDQIVTLDEIAALAAATDVATPERGEAE